MITLITGQPGAGKTLYALALLLAEEPKLKAAGRQIFVDGVTGLQRDEWAPIDGKEWMAAPDGAFIFLDEAQRIFRPRGNGSQVPAHVAALETHRHRGIDIVLVTQHPKLIDTNVRRLCGRHLHVKRNFGMHRATIHEWSEVNLDPDQSRSDSIRHEFAYPREVFNVYKSAEIHTHKRRVPPRFLFLFLIPLALLAIVYWLYASWFQSKATPDEPPAVKQEKKSLLQLPGSNNKPGQDEKRTDPASWIEAKTPRIQGMAWTAPIYDAVTTPAFAPVPAACVSSRTSCVCYSQQATRLDMPDNLCRSIVAGGYFVDFQDNSPRHVPAATERSKQDNIEQPQPVL